jgi:Rrf2 family iron-sulfur cluster assembly transcriptional regulator
MDQSPWLQPLSGSRCRCLTLSNCSANYVATDSSRVLVARVVGIQSCRGIESISVADIMVAVDEPLGAAGFGGKEIGACDETGRGMTHDLWVSLNVKMVEFLDSISLKKLVDDQIVKGIHVDTAAARRAIAPRPVAKPIKTNAPNSVFALGDTVRK